MRRIVKYSGNDVRSLTITDTNRFNFEAKFPALLNGSRKTTFLSLEGSPVNAGDCLSRASWTLANLKHLILKSHMFQKHSVPGPSDTNRLLRDILVRNVDHLESVCITSDHVNFGPTWPRMENLKALKIVETLKVTISRNTVGQRHAQLVELPTLWTKAPKIQQLWLDVSYCVGHDHDMYGPAPSTAWPNLQSLVVGAGVNWGHLGAPYEQLRFLWCLENTQDGPPEMLTLAPDVEDTISQGPDGALSKLQHMYVPRFCGDMTSANIPGVVLIREGVEAAVASGTLRTLAMKIAMKTQEREYINQFNWLRGCVSLRTLSLFVTAEPFRARLVASYSGRAHMPWFSTSAKEVAGLVASFPNLETLEVSHEEDEISTIGAIIEAVAQESGSVKVIYQDKIIGAPYDNLKDYLKKRSVELRYGRLSLPEFPLKLEGL